MGEISLNREHHCIERLLYSHPHFFFEYEMYYLLQLIKLKKQLVTALHGVLRTIGTVILIKEERTRK